MSKHWIQLSVCAVALVFGYVGWSSNAINPAHASPMQLQVTSGSPRGGTSLMQSVFGSELACSPAPCVFRNTVVSAGYASETPIVADPLNPRHLLVGSNTSTCPHPPLSLGNAGLGYYASSDGGFTWLRTCGTILPGSLPGGLDPVVAYDLRGVAYRGAIDYEQVGQDYKLRNIVDRSTDNGRTWSAPIVAAEAISTPGLFYGAGKVWMQIDTSPESPRKNTIYLSSLQFTQDQNGTITENGFTMSHSIDGGQTWRIARASIIDRAPYLECCGTIAISKYGTVYHAWIRCKSVGSGSSATCSGTIAEMLISKSTDGGETWSDATLIHRVAIAPGTCGGQFGCLPNTSEPVNDYPVLSIDNSSGWNAGALYIVDYTFASGHMEVQVAASRDGAITWSNPVSVTGRAYTHDQFFPWIGVSRHGMVGVTWLDRRNDPANVSYEAFAAVSDDGARTFSRNYQLALKLSNPNNDGVGGVFMGDYTGNSWAGDNLYAAWPDTSNGQYAQAEVGGLRIGQL